MSVADSEASYSSGYTSTAGTNESWLAASDAHLYRLNGSAHGERYTRADTETRSAVIERIRTTNGTRVSLTSANYAAMDHASLFSWNSVADASRVSESREAETATANEATAELCLSLRRRSDRSVYLAGRPNLRLPAGKLRPWVVFTPETMCITNNNSRRLFIRVSKTVATGVATYRSDSLYCGRPASVRIMTEQHWIYLNLQIRKRAANKSFAGQPYVSLGSMELDCEKPIGDIRNRSMRDREQHVSSSVRGALIVYQASPVQPQSRHHQPLNLQHLFTRPELVSQLTSRKSLFGIIRLSRKDAIWESILSRCLVVNYCTDMAHLMFCARRVDLASLTPIYCTMYLTTNQRQASGVSAPIPARRNPVALAGFPSRQRRRL